MTYWQVYNAYGRTYLAEGDSAQEAIDNARPLFASNWLDAGQGRKMANPEYAQVGMTAVALTVDVPDGLAETIGRMLRRHVDAELSVLPEQSPFRDRPGTAPVQVSPGCREASFGWVHVKPSCRCSR